MVSGIKGVRIKWLEVGGKVKRLQRNKGNFLFTQHSDAANIYSLL